MQIQPVGDETALILSEEALRLMNVRVGDSVFLVEGSEGYKVVPRNSELGESLAIAEKAMAQFSGALKKLSES